MWLQSYLPISCSKSTRFLLFHSKSILFRVGGKERETERERERERERESEREKRETEVAILFLLNYLQNRDGANRRETEVRFGHWWTPRDGT